MRIPLVPALAAGTLALLTAAPSLADNVYLTNGKSFEGVVARVEEAHVLIQMPGGEIRLSKASVERVEQGESAFADYLQRKQALARKGSAEEWLALARWASVHGLDQGARESALRAAQLDPHLAGLAPILRAHGYVYDRELDRYIPYADAMRRRGFVNSGGRWITREEQAEIGREREERREREVALRAAEAARAASEAQRQLAEVQLYQQEAAAQQGVASPAYPPGYYPPYGVTLGVFPGFFPPVFLRHGRDGFRGPREEHEPPGHGRDRGSEDFRRDSARGYESLVGRVPGSLLPIVPPAHRP
jgi:hypothetical protein